MSSISSYSGSYSSYGNYSSSSQVRQRPTEEEMAAKKKEMFDKTDTDGNGTLSKSEFSDFLSNGPNGDSIDVDSTFTSFDTNGDGSISQDEMDTGMKNLRSQMESTMNKMRFGADQSSDASSGASAKTEGHQHGGGMKEMFSKADSSGDGSIDSTEFADFISKGPQADSINAEEAFKKYDTNSDGQLSSDEFQAGMKEMMASMPPPPPPSGSGSGSNSNNSSSSDAKSIMSSLDSDGDGNISESELATGLSSTKIQQMIASYMKQMSSSYSSGTDSLLSSLTA